MQLTEQAQILLDTIQNMVPVDPDLQKFQESISTGDGFWYGITNGFINPKDILVGSDLVKVQEAVSLLETLQALWDEISIEF